MIIIIDSSESSRFLLMPESFVVEKVVSSTKTCDSHSESDIVVQLNF